MPLHILTALIQSLPMSHACGSTVFLKMEALQPPGSFKIRGIGHACEEHARRGAKRFVSFSGGNAGIAVAYAGRCLSVPVVVVVGLNDHKAMKRLQPLYRSAKQVHRAASLAPTENTH